MNAKNTPLTLIIMDGWGLSSRVEGNAIAQALKPNIDLFMSEYPNTTLSATGEDVGLPEGQMGNSEVGHLNIGAGRIVYQEFTRINRAIRDGSYFTNDTFLAAINHVKRNNSALHLVGLFSDGGVHSHINHLFALLELARRNSLQHVYVHCFLDGRDVPPANALEYVHQLEDKFNTLGIGRIATITGRYYGMDRDRRWDRTKRAYQAMVSGEGLKAGSAEEAIEDAYKRGETDEFVQPVVILGNEGKMVAAIENNDSIVFFNFRPDRARQISHAFVDEQFTGFERRIQRTGIYFACMTLYDHTIDAPVAFKPHSLTNTLGEVLSSYGLKQLRLAETEKYAHVTFFFNGGVEAPNPGEDRLLIPSPKVATYDLKPEMSAIEVTNAFLEQLAENKYQVVIMNYANADMVGHTGDLAATIKAIEVIDSCLEKVVKAILAKGGIALITSDHGNAEEMLDMEGHIHTAHTTNSVPFILISQNLKNIRLHKGRLEDIAPTMLNLIDIPQSEEMSGHNLISK